MKAIFPNCTLQRSGELSHTEGRIEISKQIMEKNGFATQSREPTLVRISWNRRQTLPND